MKKLAVLAALSLSALSAQAASPQSSVDVFYANQTLKLDVPGFGSADFDGDAFGVRGKFGLTQNFFLGGQYESGSYSESGVDIDLDDLRLGGGYGLLIAPTVQVFGQLEYADLKLESQGIKSTADGFGVHVGIDGALSRTLSAYARGGLLRLEDDGSNKIDGTEFLMGLAGNFGRFGLFGEYRVTSLEDDADTQYDLDGFRLGARFNF